MKFEMPETLDGLTLAQVSELYQAAMAEATELNAIADNEITDEQVADLVSLVQHVDALQGRQDALETEAAESAERLAAARSRLAEASTAGDPEEEEAEEEAEEEEEAPAESRELVTASAGRSVGRGSFARRAAQRTPEPVEDEPEAPKGALSIIASANISGFTSGQELSDFDELARAFTQRGKSFASGGKAGKGVLRNPGVYQLSPNAQRFSVAQLRKAESEFTIEEKMSAEDQFALIQRVASEARLPGGSLTAAGGWCAPSEQIWSFLELETMEGLLSIPEVTARRGGVTWTPGPQLSDLLGDEDFGFYQTETEAEAGEVKSCYELECPEWDEVRLDAIGFCIKAGLLTNAAYPELVRRVLQLGLIAHARRVNARTIAAISAAIGAATTFAPVGADGYSATADLLSAVELNAIRVREAHAMAINATLEAIFPIWVKAVVRAELSRREGVDFMNVTDQMITGWFTTRGIAAQFVRDYQPISSAAVSTAGGTAGWTRLPNRVEFMVYPAGAYVRLGTDVIDVDTVYDTDGLTHNTYTAAFFEEGFGLLNAGGTGVKVLVNLDNVNGATGFPAIGAGEGVSIPVPVEEVPAG